MIKTHGPRGYHWTNASTFQQTDGYRRIELDEWYQATAEAYRAGPDETLPRGQQDRKRHRIEKLAQDFLDGQPLRILSARPNPTTLRDTVVWNKKSSNEPKFIWNQSSRSQSDSLWEDAEDEDEVLRRAICSRRQSSTEKVDCADATHLNDSFDDLVVEERALASCEPSAGTRAIRLAALPSEEALRRAAALRDRALRSFHYEKQVTTASIGPPSDVRCAEGTPLEPIDSDLPTTTWLSRRTSSTFRPEIDDKSLDELRLLGVESPSRQLRRVHKTVRGSPGPHLSTAEQLDQHHPAGTTRGTNIRVVFDAPSILPTSTTSISHDGGLSSTAIPHDGATNAPTFRSLDGPAVDFATPAPAILEPALSDRRRFHNGPRAYTSEQGRDIDVTPFIFRKRASRPDDAIPHNKAASRQCGLGNLAAAPSSVQSSPPRRISDIAAVQPEDANRCASEPPTTAPDSAGQSNRDDGTSLMSKTAAPSQFWPGTQVMLQQAQERLFASPEKNLKGSKDWASPHVPQSCEHPPAKTTSKGSLKRFSRELLPSTQALMEDFVGFSTVKKPRTAHVGSLIPTPTARNIANHRKQKAMLPAESLSVQSAKSRSDKGGRRISSLHVGSSVDSPRLRPGQFSRLSNDTTSLALAPDDAASSDMPDSELEIDPGTSFHCSVRSSQAQDSLPLDSQPLYRRTTSSESFVSAREVSSLQCAQHPSFGRENQGTVEQVFQELTTEILGLEDMDGLLS